MDVADLYGLALERFVPERNALARALRADGKRDAAAKVAGVRKPSVAAWAVNQLVRTQRRALAALFDAGDALRGAHADVLAGRADGRVLRAAAERERDAAEALVNAARGLLSSEGHELSAAIIDRVADTLHAAALDDDAREAVRAGRLERELRHVGLGVASAASGTPARRSTKGRAATKRERAERERSQALKIARGAEAEARSLADRSARAVLLAEQRRERAAQALHEADNGLGTARAQAEAADDAHRRAQEHLRSL